MAQYQDRPIAKFPAVDGRGTKYMITVFQRFIRTGAVGVDDDWLPGIKKYRTHTGDPVNHVEKGKYRLLDGTELTSDDPNAL